VFFQLRCVICQQEALRESGSAGTICNRSVTSPRRACYFSTREHKYPRNSKDVCWFSLHWKS